MQASIQLSEDDYLKARTLWHRLHSRMTREGRFAFAGFCILLAIYGFVEGRGGWSPAGMLVAGGLVLLPLWLLPWRWRRTYRQLLAAQYPMDVELNEEGVAIRGAHGLEWQGVWGDLSSWMIAEGFLFLVHQNRRVVSILPIAQFAEEAAEVQPLLEKHLPSYLEQRNA